MKKRWLATLLSLCLIVGLFPTAVLAEGNHWAEDAVTALEDVYGAGIFAAEDTPMTEGDAHTVLERMGSESAQVIQDSPTALTRGKVCAILAEIFQLPVDGTSAIEYLYKQNIINGKSENDLEEEGCVTKAQFAVLTYRVLNFVGGGEGSGISTLKPGTKEYFSWMYLAARRADSFHVDATKGNITQENWATWSTMMMRAEIPADAKPDSFYLACPDTSVSKLDAAVQMVDAYIAAGGSDTIFSDVKPGDWWYDGVMYLFDQQLIQGQGNGTFGLNVVPPFQLAVLLATLDQAECAVPTNPDRIKDCIEYVIGKEYMTGDPVNTTQEALSSPEWGMSAYVTREDTVVAVLKQQKVEVSGVNNEILNRFDDSGKISEEAKPYLAYAVSRGFISGTSETTINPTGAVKRPEIGVILYRVLVGLDSTKMQDYRENIGFVMPDETAGQ